MGNFWVAFGVGLALALLAGWIWRRGRAAQRRAQYQLAQLDFLERQHELVPNFLKAANATGMPRGLEWIGCELGDDVLFATDRVTGELYALCGATISFAAIPGGGMEEVEAVGNLRYATVFFVNRRGIWQSDGQSVFNLEPAASLERYQESLAPVEQPVPSPTLAAE